MNWTMFLAVVLSTAESSMPEIGEIIEMLENSQGLIQGIVGLLGAIVSLISILGTVIASVLGIASSAFTLIFTIVVVLAVVIYWIVFYFGSAIPLFVVGRRAKCKYAWLAWVPIFQDVFSIFVMWKISGKEPFEFWNGKICIKQSLLAVAAYPLIQFFGAFIVSFIVTILNVIPGFGQVASLLANLLYCIPAFFLGVIEYVYLRDVIQVFRADEKKCRLHAFVVVILDNLLTLGWARNIYLISLMGKKPLPKEEYPVVPEV